MATSSALSPNQLGTLGCHLMELCSAVCSLSPAVICNVYYCSSCRVCLSGGHSAQNVTCSPLPCPSRGALQPHRLRLASPTVLATVAARLQPGARSCRQQLDPPRFTVCLTCLVQIPVQIINDVLVYCIFE
ncbi:unnamed protein product [Protopolystoma xenopodis]|uniref:Uncharacterized protein n=1 Tax=Protopolystoma xenopodis TaxID=117903 RepID=A0A3S5BYT5_9PLAT|nr:unnamed protein product [Protopolystoma xenopodis]